MGSPPRFEQGASVGPYVIAEPIGAGAMGEVYRARDPRLGRDVAVKVLAAAPDADRLARFEREARATAVLAHPNIVTIFDVGVQDGVPFMVSELLEGQTLRRCLESGPMATPRALELALAAAGGMAAAHSLRIIHRDLKPENLFLTRSGTLKILDFGLAKLGPDPVAVPDLSTVDATQPGTLLGTPSYMAPEQLRGEPVDERADIFAIGAILYEMLTGQSPFRRTSAAGTLAAILHEDPPPLEARVERPAALDSLVLHCLEKDPAERFQSARDLAFALESLLSDLRRPAGATQGRTSSIGASSIAVLPFADMSPTRDQDWLCEGIAEELINALTHIEGCRVAARSSSFQFRGQAADIRAVGARLGVATVLEGSVRKIGDRLRVTVQLVDVVDGCHRWAQRFDRTPADVFAIQDEIAESVATALRGILSPREKEALRRPETAVEAYEYFLRGRQHLHRWRRAAMDQARALFERAIQIDRGLPRRGRASRRSTPGCTSGGAAVRRISARRRRRVAGPSSWRPACRTRTPLGGSSCPWTGGMTPRKRSSRKRSGSTPTPSTHTTCTRGRVSRGAASNGPWSCSGGPARCARRTSRARSCSSSHCESWGARRRRSRPAGKGSGGPSSGSISTRRTSAPFPSARMPWTPPAGANRPSDGPAALSNSARTTRASSSTAPAFGRGRA